MAAPLAGKPRIPEGPGTLATRGPLFGMSVIGVFLLGALNVFPTLALGPWSGH